MRTGFARVASLLLALVLLVGCQPASFSGRQAFKHVKALDALGPRYVGSEANQAAADYIAKTLEEYGWEVTRQNLAYGGERLQNVIATRGTGPTVLLGTHYDTRPIAENDRVEPTSPVPGANDGGSGVGVLLELARTLDPAITAERSVMLAFFDGEDRGGIDGWEWAVGARHLARQLANDANSRPEWVLIVDMVGDANQELFWEWSSSVSLNETVWRVAHDLGYEQQFVARHKHYLIADHTPFAEMGMQAAILIDFDYPYWHTRQDTLYKISVDSLQRVGDVITAFVQQQ